MPADTRLDNGVWVLAIPEPYQLLIRVRCACGRKFWSRKEYAVHYTVHRCEAPNAR